MPVVLIHGIDSLFGGYVAQRLAADDQLQLIGLGRRMPVVPVDRTALLIAPLSGQQLVELLRAEQVHTVVHLAYLGEEEPAPSREAVVRQNVLGTMEVLGACARAGVARVVVRSSTMVYGANPDNPAFMTENQAPASPSGQIGLVRDYIEIDTFVTDFVARHPELQVVLLRCASLLGGEITSPLGRYLAEPFPRMLFGFDPRIQVVHTSDAVAAFELATTASAAGVFNIASPDPITLSQAIRLAGHQPLPLFEPVVDLAGLLGNAREVLGAWPFGRDFLRYHCVADTQRAQAQLGWTPRYEATSVLREVGSQRVSDERAQAETALRAFLSRRSES